MPRLSPLAGQGRLVSYIVIQVCVFALPCYALPGVAVALLALARLDAAGPEGRTGIPVPPRGGLRAPTAQPAPRIGRLWPVMLVALSPALVSVPFGTEGIRNFFALWLPGLVRSARLALVFWSAAWLSRGMSPVELRDALAPGLRVLGPRAQASIARAASLMLAFLPWTMAELKRADEAARLRGSDPKRRPGSHLSALAVPVSVRSLEKARRSAEALSLRDAGFR